MAKKEAIFCGHCGVPIAGKPEAFKEYRHSHEGACPFRGVVMLPEAWKALEAVYQSMSI